MKLLLLQALMVAMALAMAAVPLVSSLHAAMVICEQTHSYDTCLETIWG